MRTLLGYKTTAWKSTRKKPTPWAKAAVRLAYINVCLRAKNRELKQQIAKTAAKTNSQAKGRRSTKK